MTTSDATAGSWLYFDLPLCFITPLGAIRQKSKSHLKAKTLAQTPAIVWVHVRPLLYPCAAKVSSEAHTSAFMANFRAGLFLDSGLLDALSRQRGRKLMRKGMIFSASNSFQIPRASVQCFAVCSVYDFLVQDHNSATQVHSGAR